jgi:methylmalonyl-CoA mutase
MFVAPHADDASKPVVLARSTDDEKRGQLQRLRDFHARHADDAPQAMKHLQQAVIESRNVFEALLDAVRVCSLGQITHALFEVGGQYRRTM